jgi:hypothetical protein
VLVTNLPNSRSQIVKADEQIRSKETIVKMSPKIWQLSGTLKPLFFAAVIIMSAEAKALDFKGIKLGSHLMVAAERSAFGTLDCNPMQMETNEYQIYLQEMRSIMPDVQEICVANTSIATVPADVTVVFGSYRRVLRLTFQFAGENYSLVTEAMTSKWGEGVMEVRDQFDESAWWVFDDGTSISVHQIPADDDTTVVEDSSSVGLAVYALPATTPAGDL